MAPPLTATVSLDTGRMAAQLAKRGAAALARRADRLGIQMEKIIADMIDGELGPDSGRSRQRGMVPMREIDWQHEVLNPGRPPVRGKLFSPDLAGPTAAKFAALNYGSRPHRINARLSFEGTNDRAGKGVVVRGIDHPGTAGHDWLFRTAEIAFGRAASRF